MQKARPGLSGAGFLGAATKNPGLPSVTGARDRFYWRRMMVASKMVPL